MRFQDIREYMVEREFITPEYGKLGVKNGLDETVYYRKSGV
jgi:hypothetical protein